MILANHGITRAHIIVADNASCATVRAANELSRYIYKISAANITIHKASRATIGNKDAAEICVGLTGQAGEPDISGLKNDGYIHKTVGNRLFILGENDRAILHAVYAFLEDELGCRFFSDTVEHIPSRSYLRIGDIDKTIISPFEYREVFGNVCYDDDEYASKRGLNGNGYDLDKEHGGSISYHGFVHTFNKYIPVFEFYDEHPEYFSMINGERFDGGDGKYVHSGNYVVNTQLCLSNPDVFQLMVKRLREQIEKHPEATIFSISQNDWGEPCECPECKKIDEEEGSPAGSLIRFVNTIANDIAKDYPNIIIDTLAYRYSRKPPKTKPAPNVVVRLCTIECCFSHAISECDYKSSKEFTNYLTNWAKLSNRLYIWDYTTNFRHYLNPLPNLFALQKNIQFFVENGVTGLFSQGNGEDLSGEFGELRYYIISKLMWEPYGDVDRWIREFMAVYYGMGAQPIREYIDAMFDHITKENIHVKLYDHPDLGHFPPWLIDFANKKFDEAEALADNESVLERIRKSRMHIKYCELYNMDRNGPNYNTACEKFIDEINHFGFTRIREWMPLSESFDELRNPIRNV